ncbi:MAG TPA: hypothetical protein VFW28_15560 [Micropepsaceae bacterium]|nr:hypothetical protein [Micropepsaceae bacterium]
MNRLRNCGEPARDPTFFFPGKIQGAIQRADRRRNDGDFTGRWIDFDNEASRPRIGAKNHFNGFAIYFEKLTLDAANWCEAVLFAFFFSVPVHAAVPDAISVIQCDDLPFWLCATGVDAPPLGIRLPLAPSPHKRKIPLPEYQNKTLFYNTNLSLFG